MNKENYNLTLSQDEVVTVVMSLVGVQSMISGQMADKAMGAPERFAMSLMKAQVAKVLDEVKRVVGNDDFEEIVAMFEDEGKGQGPKAVK